MRRERAIDAFGVEYLAEKVAIAKADSELSPFIFQGDLQKIPFESSSFDAALALVPARHEDGGIPVIHWLARCCPPYGDD